MHTMTLRQMFFVFFPEWNGEVCPNFFAKDVTLLHDNCVKNT